MLRSRPISIASVVVFLPVTFAVAIIIYILMGTNGHIWASAPLDTGFFLASGLNLVGFVSALAHHSAKFFIANIVLSVLIVLTFFGAVISSFPGTGGRYGNYGFGGAPYIGLICAVLIVAQNAKWMKSFGVATALAVLVVPPATYSILSAPLYATIREIDLSSTCLIQTTSYDYGYLNAQRIYSADDLELGILIGEHSPRVVRIAKMRTSNWRYSGRKFGRSRSLARLPLICATDTPKEK